MNVMQVIIMLTEAITDPVFAVLYAFFTAVLNLPGIDLITIFRALWALL